MKQIFDQLLQFLQQGIAAIFRFVHLVWGWSIDQITKVFQTPWATWPLWKQILSVLIVAAVIFFVFKAARDLWFSGIRVLRAFASLLVAFVMTLPAILAAGVIAFGGLWLINNLSFSNWPTITSISSNGNGDKEASSNKRSGQPNIDTVGQGGSRNGEPNRKNDNGK